MDVFRRKLFVNWEFLCITEPTRGGIRVEMENLVILRTSGTKNLGQEQILRYAQDDRQRLLRMTTKSRA